MYSAPFSRPIRKLKLTLAVVFSVLGAAQAKEPWHLLIEPSFMKYEAAWPITASERTVLVPARVINGEIVPLKRAEVTKEGITRQDILADAPLTAADAMAQLKPRYVRDENEVIQYAILESESELTASAVLAPGFAEKFSDTLGPDILIAIPNRNRIFVFPKLSPIFKQMTDLIIAEYESSSHPVSRELFTLRGGKLIAVGRYQ